MASIEAPEAKHEKSTVIFTVQPSLSSEEYDGIAGLFAFLLGIVGCILGMVQTWYVAVIAAMIGESGGDIGNQLAFMFTLVCYVPLRYRERGHFPGR